MNNFYKLYSKLHNKCTTCQQLEMSRISPGVSWVILNAPGHQFEFQADTFSVPSHHNHAWRLFNSQI